MICMLKLCILDEFKLLFAVLRMGKLYGDRKNYHLYLYSMYAFMVNQS